MTPHDVPAWLGSLGLSEYTPQFRDNHVDGEVLRELTADDLKELGVASLGHRKKLLAAIAALREPPPPAPVARPAEREAERRQVTILFADITGYTALSQELGPEELHRLLTRYTEVVDGVIVGRGGTVDKHIGDAVMALFGAPVAHGDDPLRAAAAALDVHAAMERLSVELGRTLSVHIGMAAGEVVAAPMVRGAGRDYTVLGDAVNLAARLDALAKGGETLVSESVAWALDGQAHLEPLGERTLKGFAEPVKVHRLVQLRPRTAARTLFVGRRAELGRLEALVDRVRGGGGSCMVVRGEPGVGKSRLVDETLRLARAGGVAVHRSLVLDFGVAAGQDATGALVRSFLGIDGEARIPDASELREAAQRLDVPLEMEAFLHDAVGAPIPAELARDADALDRDRKAAMRRRMVAHLATASARARPQLVVVEDVHWADHGTLETVDALAAATGAAPLLLLATSRPELGLACKRLFDRPGVEVIDLEPLSADDARSLARAVGDDDATLDALVARSGGNPLFLEQLLKSAHEGAAAIPASIQSLVLARLDCLQGSDREALQVASVLGQRLVLPSLQALLSDPGYDATELLERGLLRPDGGALMFVHALVQEGVYNSLMAARRRELHRAAAAHFAGSDLTLHARHLGRAEDPAAPAAYLEAARARAATFHLEEALELIGSGLELPASASSPALANLGGQLLLDLGNVEGALAAFGRALDAGASGGDACRAHAGMADCYRVTDRYPEALAQLDAAAAAAEGGAAGRARIHAVRGSVYFPLGRIAECRAEQAAALEHAMAAGDAEMIAVGLSGLGDAEYARGHARSAALFFGRCVAHCEAHGLGRHVNVNRAMQCGSRFLDLDVDGLFETIDVVVADTVRLGQLRAETIARVLRLICVSETAVERHTREEAARAEECARRLGSPRFVAEVMALDARALMEAGALDEARSRSEAALAVARATGMAFYGPVILGAAARLATRDDDRRAALAEGEALLAAGSLIHNHLCFRRDALQACHEAGDLEGLAHHTAALDAYAPGERSGWVDFWTSWGKAVLAGARGRDREVDTERLRLVERARRLGLHSALRGLGAA